MPPGTREDEIPDNVQTEIGNRLLFKKKGLLVFGRGRWVLKRLTRTPNNHFSRVIHIDANLTLGTLVADRMHLNRLALLIFTIRTVHKFPLMKGTPYI